MSEDNVEAITTTSSTQLESGPFVLRNLLDDVPLLADGDAREIRINCVEFLDSNLYIGTSASEILHFVQIPPDTDDPNGQPSYILASRLPPQGESTNSPDQPGVQQILLLPRVQKCVVLCNGIITFYSLPELSPIFENVARLENCGWVGGIDLNVDSRTLDESPSAFITVLLSLRKRLRPVNIGQRARGLPTIDYTGSIISIRRDTIACVADNRSYALLDIDQQLKIPLFPISSLETTPLGNIGGRAEDISTSSATVTSTNENQTPIETASHSRNSSLGIPINTARERTSNNGEQDTQQTAGQADRVPSPAPTSPTQSTAQQDDGTKSTTPPEQVIPTSSAVDESSTTIQQTTSTAQTLSQAPTVPIAPVYLKPHIVSPSSQEFLLVTGTDPLEPGVGMFVNLDGDVTRSTLEFERYPLSLVVDGRGQGIDFDVNNADDDEEGYVIASMSKMQEDETRFGLEIQRWDLDPGEGSLQKSWLPMPREQNTASDDLGIDSRNVPGLRCVTDKGDINFSDVVNRLRLRRFRPMSQNTRMGREAEYDSSLRQEPEDTSPTDDMAEGAEQLRSEEEQQFARRLGLVKTRVVVWSGGRIWWAVRNPLVLRLDAGLPSSTAIEEMAISLDRRKTVETINSIRGREAKTEVEFIGLGYIRQRAGLLLLVNLLSSDIPPLDAADRIAEEALLSSGLDPRVILSLVPSLRREIIEGKHGIWIHGGVLETAQTFLNNFTNTTRDQQYILHFYRRYLVAWRSKRGFGSIANEQEVFQSLDAALLVILLQLDASTPQSELSRPPVKGSIRYELYTLVDNGVECFERAILLLEQYDRLYVLSRLYQSRKMSAEVLSTWRRIVENPSPNARHEFTDGLQEFRKYLTKISNPALVEEYGVWLAARNTRLGIQVFADDRARVKFEPAQVVAALRKGAPSAIKEYLEYLVFAKNHTQHVNELISYYLDIVISTLETSTSARELLLQSYSTYRALSSPKPTYRQFITDNAIPDEWWHARLRLLQLLGGGSQDDSSTPTTTTNTNTTPAPTISYDIDSILTRITPYTQYLVPEIIILQGRRGMHDQALELLVNDLGDFDTAVCYCLKGGVAIYHPIGGVGGSMATTDVGLSNGSTPTTTTTTTTPTITTTTTSQPQSTLFTTLLNLYLHLPDPHIRSHEVTHLLLHHGPYLDIAQVLQSLPDEWSIELVAGYLIQALREIVVLKRASGVEKALWAVECLGAVWEVGELGRGGVLEG